MLNYKNFIQKLNERAPSITKKEEIWKRRGKKGKECILYLHDDLDGVFSAIVMQGWLKDHGFKMAGFGIVNYQEGWNSLTLKPEYINIALDYAENVKGIDVYIDHHGSFENEELLGMNVSIAREDPAAKTKTGSAYEGICRQLGIPTDSLVLDVIDMIDSAKYDDYGVDITTILDFDPKKFKNKLQFAGAFNQLLKRSDFKTFIEVVANCKDRAPSVYRIFDLFKKLYPGNNLDLKKIRDMALNSFGLKVGPWKTSDMTYVDFYKWLDKEVSEAEKIALLDTCRKDFVEDAHSRLGQMQSRTSGKQMSKEYVRDQADFMRKFKTGKNGKVEVPGYQILGQMMFVPTGTWANALRARAIIEKDLVDNSDYIPTIKYNVTPDSVDYDKFLEMDGQQLELVGDIDNTNAVNVKFTIKDDVTNNPDIEGIKGIIKVKGDNVVFEAKQPLFFIMLQYGNTLQVCTLHKFDKYVTEYLPKTKDGVVIDNLGEYCNNLLNEFVTRFGYNKDLIPDMSTKSGGHIGIGTISNIAGRAHEYNMIDRSANVLKYDGVKFLDLIKNKMISDLSRIKWSDVGMVWGDPEESGGAMKDMEMDRKLMMMDQIRIL